MVLEGSGKEGVRVDSMQEESQQPQQVSGETLTNLQARTYVPYPGVYVLM